MGQPSTLHGCRPQTCAFPKVHSEILCIALPTGVVCSSNEVRPRLLEKYSWSPIILQTTSPETHHFHKGCGQKDLVAASKFKTVLSMVFPKAGHLGLCGMNATCQCFKAPAQMFPNGSRCFLFPTRLGETCQAWGFPMAKQSWEVGCTPN